MAFALSFLKSQLLTWLPYPNDDFSGQTIIVTGANTGLGLEAARHLVRLNAEKVIIACRTTSKGEAAKLNILQTTKAKKDVVEVWQLDLSDYDSIRAFAKKVQTLKRLDAFIQNAGIMTRKWAMVQGVESTISVNVISGVLCALMVLPKLRETGKTYGTKTRLSFVGSDLQAVAKFVEADTNGSLLDSLNVQKEDLADRYPTSKLLLLYAIRELAARSPLGPDSNVVINLVTPGACVSDIFRDEKTMALTIIHWIMNHMIARTAEAGSRTLVHAARPGIPDNEHGAFLKDCTIWSFGPNVESPRGEKLHKKWVGELFAKLESIEPGVTKVLN